MTKEEIRNKAIECARALTEHCESHPLEYDGEHNHCVGCKYDVHGIEDYSCNVVYGYTHGFADGVEEGKQIALTAIEKQIPKKPRFEGLGYDLHHNVNVYGILCPDCGGLIIKCNSDDFDGEFPNAIWEEWDMKAVKINNGYCGHCGQRIDWTEGEKA